MKEVLKVNTRKLSLQAAETPSRPIERSIARGRAGYGKVVRQCTVVSDENFQIPGQKIFSEISGPGPSYLSLGTSQDHILSYFAHMCLGAQVQCGEARENGHFWDYFV